MWTSKSGLRERNPRISSTGAMSSCVIRWPGAREAALSPEWKEFTVEGVVGDDVDGLVMLKLNGPMEVAVDDARLVDTSALTANAPPQAGNLLA